MLCDDLEVRMGLGGAVGAGLKRNIQLYTYSWLMLYSRNQYCKAIIL